MDLRSIVIALIIVVGCVWALKRSYIGVMLLSWIGYMNPHRLVPWGFIYTMPVAMVAAVFTLLGYMLEKDKKPFPLKAPIVWMFIFIIWCVICTVFAIFPDRAMEEMSRFIKIQIAIIFTLLICQDEKKIIALLWAIVVSIGFYGVKGGIFTIRTLGAFRVWGPPDSFITGNNEVALALLMVIPLMVFLYQYHQQKWIKWALIIAILLSTAAVIGSQSRGAFLGLIATGGFLWLKSSKKFALAAAMIILVMAAIPFIPQHWTDRMNTIQTYEEDRSAMGRINAWTLAYNLAKDRITGGGFRQTSAETFLLYAPDPESIHDAHSIYFEVLGELGFIGLIIFLAMYYSTWRLAKKTITQANESDTKWIADLMRMVQVALIAYASGGAFLGLAFWDLPYHLITIIVLTAVIQERAAQAVPVSQNISNTKKLT